MRRNMWAVRTMILFWAAWGAAQGQDPIVDGGFEKGEVHWAPFLPGDSKVKGGQVAFMAGGRSGNAAELSAEDYARVLLQQRQAIPVKAGDLYRVSAWFKNGGNAEIRANQPGPMVRLVFRDATGKDMDPVNILSDGRVVPQPKMTETAMPKALPEGWFHVSGEVIVPPGAESVLPMVSATQMKGRLLVDDFSMENITPGANVKSASLTVQKVAPGAPVDYVKASALLSGGLTIPPPPAGGTDILGQGEPVFTSWASAGVWTATNMPGLGLVHRVATRSRPQMMHGVALAFKIEEAIEPGDTLLLEIWIRGVELQSAAYMVQVYTLLRGEGEQMTKSTLPTGEQWKCYRLPCTTARGQKAGDTFLDLQFGFDPQVVEVGGIRLLNYKKGQTLTSLPSTGFDYAGRATDAPWRKAALEKIQSLRARNLTVTVKDGAGRPVVGEEVWVQQKKHLFPFGTAWNTAVASGKDGVRYRQTLQENFTRVTFEGEMKWEAWERPKTRQTLQDEMDWLTARGIEVYGHTLVWGGWQFLPKRLKALEKDPQALAQEVRAHLDDQVLAMKGRVVAWDVVNEAFTQRSLIQILGRSAVPEWYRHVASIDPRPKLVLNDYAILDSRANSPEQRDFVEALAREVKGAGAPIHGLGFQGHMYPPFTPPEELLKILDRFAALGLEIYITEHDINTFDETLQGDYARDFLIAVMSHPAVKGFTLWGFWDGAHWKNNALLYRKDWSLKPSGSQWLGLVKGKWWTDTKVKTDENGRFTLPVWMGDYVVGGKEVTVGEGGANINLDTRR